MFRHFKYQNNEKLMSHTYGYIASTHWKWKQNSSPQKTKTLLGAGTRAQSRTWRNILYYRMRHAACACRRLGQAGGASSATILPLPSPSAVVWVVFLLLAVAHSSRIFRENSAAARRCLPVRCPSQCIISSFRVRARERWCTYHCSAKKTRVW